jgi:Na+-driven multidrug efflux pump
MYFGIFFGISVGLMLLAALACALAGETRQRKEFRSCFVITILLALVLMGVAVYWEASPWPFGK